MLATDVLNFLLFDVLSKVSESITTALDQVRTHLTGAGTFVTLDERCFSLPVLPCYPSLPI
jgi:hypothetical protein